MARTGRPINAELLRIIDRALEMDERQSAQDSETLALVQRDAEQAARAARQAQYAINMVNASPLDALPELRHALLVGGTTALHAFSHAVESGTVRVRTGKVSPVRNSEPRTTLCHATQSHTHSLARPALSRIYTNL